MYSSLIYINADSTMIRATRLDGSMVIIEPVNGDLWTLATSGDLGAVSAYVPPPEPTDAELLAAERKSMSCTAAEMRIALHRAGRLVAAEAVAVADSETAIVWEYETTFYRLDALFGALVDGGFTETEIDDLFRATQTI